jgi:hypothetical protein
MAENEHGMKFSLFSRYCKHLVKDEEGQHWVEECGNGRNRMLHRPHPRPPCNKPYCPAFRNTRVVVATRHYAQGDADK